MKIEGMRAGAGWFLRALGAVLVGLMLLAPAEAGAVSLTNVQGTVYRADGTPASGTLLVSWPSFSTSGNEAVAAGSLTVAIGSDGYIQVALAANAGAYPEGSYYTAVYHLSDGTVSREYWVVPAAAQAAVASVRAVLAPSTVATQSVSKTYVDTALAGMSNSYVPVAGGAMSGPLTLNGDPISNAQAANKHYTDQTVSQAVAGAIPLTGGTMSGALTLNGDPVLGSSNASAAVTLNWANRWPCNSATAGATHGFQSYIDISCYGAVGDSLMISGGMVTHAGSNVVLSTGSSTGVFPTTVQGNLLVVQQGGAPYMGSAAYPGTQLYGYAQYVSDHEVHLFSDMALTQPMNAGSEVGGAVTKIAGTSSGGGWSTAGCSVSGGNAGLLASANGGAGYATGATCTATIKSGNVSCSVASPGNFYTAPPVVTVTGNMGSFTNICTASIANSGGGYAAGAHSAADTAAITRAYNAAKTAVLPVYVPPLSASGLHDSRDAWGYWFAGPALSGWGRPEMAGADEFTSTIIVAPTTYLVDDASPWYSMNVHDLGFFGGIGYFRTRATSVMDTGHYVVENNSFHGFTGTAFATNQLDNPYWLFEHNTCIAANTWTGICISMGGANDSTKVEDNHFDNQRVGFKSAGPFSTVRVDRNEWLQYQTEPVSGTWGRTGIWLAAGAANDVIAENKWGNENKDQADVAMLAANSDATNCNDPFAVGLYGSCPLSNQLPLLGVQATFQVRGMHVKSNLVEGAGYASQPFLYSYTADVERNEFTDFILDGGALGYVIDVDGATNPTPGEFQYTNLCGPYMSLHPAHSLSQTGGSNLAGLCTENEPTGVYSSNNAFSIDPNTTGSNQAGFNNLLMVGAAALTQGLAADTVTTIADSQGNLGTTAATLQWTAGADSAYAGLTGTITKSEPLWVEMDLRMTAGCSGAACLTDVYPSVTNATGTVTYYGQQFAVPAAGAGWKHYRRLMWWPQGAETGLVFHLAPGPDAPSTGGMADVGLIHVYQAWQPATGSQVLDTLSVTGGAQLGGPMVLSANTKIQPAPGAGAGTVFQTPSSNGSTGYVLTTDGAGATQWSAPTAANALPLAGGAMSGPLTTPSVNNLPSAASQTGGINGWIASTIASGQRSWLWIDPQYAAGAPTSSLSSLTHFIDARGTNNLNPGAGLALSDGALGFYSAATAQQPLTSASFATNVNHGFDCQQGGVYNYIAAGGTKSNCVNVFVGSDFYTAAQHWGMYDLQNGYGGGENIGLSIYQNNYSGFIGPGQEQDESIRIQNQQASYSDGMGGVWNGTATGVNTSTGVVSFTPNQNAQTLGETRFIRDVPSVYSTGTIAGISCSGTPDICTVTGSGTGWTSIPGFVSTHTTFASATYLAPILTNNLVICIAGSANDGFDNCIPVISGTDDTHLTAAVTAVGVNATSWWGATSGGYTIYRSAYPTSTDRGANTFTACGTTYLGVTTCDVSGITSGHTLDQVLAYNGDTGAMQILVSRHIGRPNYAGGINMINPGTATSPALDYGLAVSGNFREVVAIEPSGALSGTPQYGVYNFSDPTNAWWYSNVVSTAATSAMKFRDSAGTVLTPFQFVRNPAAANYGLNLFGTATISPAGGLVATSLKDTGVSGGGTQCLHADSSGNITGAGADCAGGSPAIQATYPPSDLLCAHGGDTTVGLLTITGATNTAPPVFTVSGAPQSLGYQIGQTFAVTGATPSAYNGTYTAGANPGSATLTGSGAAPGVAWTSGGTISMVCGNSSDALNTALGTFATTLSMTIAPPAHYAVDTQWALYTPATAPALVMPKLTYNSAILTGFSTNVTVGPSAGGSNGSVKYTLSSPASGVVMGTADSESIGSGGTSYSNMHSTVFTTTGAPENLGLQSGFTATGLGSITSASGGTISGVGTCNLANFNNGLSGATATVRFITSGSWTGATFTITNGSFGGTAAATSATLTSGTATCSGTPSLVTVLGGSWGTALRLLAFTAKQQ